MKRPISLLLIGALLFALSGCSASSPESFYRLPRAGEEFESLEQCLQSALNSGYEYTSPLKGSMTQAVTVTDLDGDGVEEAVAFFRDTSGGESPLKVCLYRQDEEGEYYLFTTIEGAGNAINSASFLQLEGGDGTPEELVVTWQVSSSVYALSAYSIEEGVAVQIMESMNYSRYATADLDGDGLQELVVLQLSATDTTSRQAELYRCEDHYMVQQATASLSARLANITGLHTGLLSDGSTALFVTGYIEESGTGEVNSAYQITDIFTMRDGSFQSIAMTDTGSSSTLRYYLTGDQDINDDGVWELPSPVLLSNRDKESTDSFYAITWNQYDPDGYPEAVCTTYYNNNDGWYFDLPESWLNRLQLARSDTTSGNTVERGILFYYQASSEQEPEPLLAIYKNSGSNRVTNALTDGRLYLAEESGAVYSVKLYEAAEEYDLNAEEVLASFHLIRPDWQE